MDNTLPVIKNQPAQTSTAQVSTLSPMLMSAKARHEEVALLIGAALMRMQKRLSQGGAANGNQ